MTEFRENKDVRRPFLSIPAPSAYYPGSTIEKARRATSRCLRRDEGVALVVGSTGVGKTLLARVLASEFDEDALVAFVSPRRRLDVKSFFQQFLFGLRQTFCGCDETELRLMAFDYLERASQERCVLLVDDAQNLTLRVFDEIRGLIDQCAASTKRLSVALFGLGALEERLNLPSLFPFQQRVVSRAYLENFSRAEITKYVDCELKRAGVDARFSKAAIEQIARLSDGSPRVVNQLCDRALFLAFGGEENETFDDSDSSSKRRTERVEIDQKDVERAWARLQSLPEEEDGKTNEVKSQGNDSTSIVEFGLLDDDESDEYNNGTATPTNEAPVSEETTGGVSNPQEKTSSAETVDDRAKETYEFVSEPVVVPKPFDWEADRYGSLEEPATKDITEAKENVPASVVEANEVENAVDSSEDAEENAEKEEKKEVESIPQEEKSSDLTHEARRIRAKKAFWDDADVQDAFQAKRGESNAPSSVDVEREKAEQTEEVEKIEPEGEIDYELDARLREKFGVASDSEPTSEDSKEESVEEILPPEINLDGIRFEPRGGAELVSPSNADESIVKRARKTLRPRSFLSAKLSARSVHAPSAEPSETSESESGTFDASLEFAPGTTATLTTPKAKTRRPLQKDDDGSREFREVNGFNAEDSARFAADDRYLESQFAAFPSDSPLRSWGLSDESPNSETQVPDERAYRQIVASCYRSAADFPSSAQYLNELQLLEQEIAEEANLIRRIRNIHLRLRSVRSSDSGDKSAQDAEFSESTSALVTE